MVTVRTLSDSGLTTAEIATTTKIHEYRVGLYLRSAGGVESSRLKATVEACRDADSALKLSATDGYGVIEKLICGL